MPETLTATKIDNPQHPWTIEETVDGYRGTRWYVVNTGNVAAAIQATGIPRMGDYWDATRFPRLQVRSVGPCESWSQVQGVTDDNGWTYVPVYYDTVSSIRLTPHTVYTRTIEAQTVKKGLQYNPDRDPDAAAVPWATQTGSQIVMDTTGSKLMGNGDGATKYYSRLKAEVHCYLNIDAASFNLDVLDMMAMEPIVNSDREELPPVYGFPKGRKFGMGRLRTEGYELEMVNNYWHYTLQLEIAFNWYTYWADLNKDGVPAGEAINAAKIYRSEPLKPYIPWTPPSGGLGGGGG